MTTKHRAAQHVRWLVVLGAVVLAPFLVLGRHRLADALRSRAPADEVECFEQVNADGFGNPNNRYAWSMAEFQGKLYVGTFNTITQVAPPPEGAIPVAPESAPEPGCCHSGKAVETEGTEIWRLDETGWTKVVTAGFGSPGANEGTRSLIVHEGQLYAGTCSESTGCQLWRTADGTTWEPVDCDGFGDRGNDSIRGLASWRGRLWVGTINRPRGAEVWMHDGASWTRVASGGVTDQANWGASFLQAHHDQLYLGTYNDDGTQLYRYDGTTWERVVGPDAPTPAGFGDLKNGAILSMAEYRGALYAGTANFDDGFDVWRTLDDAQTWEPVLTDGNGEVKTHYAWKMHVHEDALYLGTWRTGSLPSDWFRTGAILYRTTDGINWDQEVGPFGRLAPAGFGDDLNYGFRTLATYQGALYVGTAQCFFCTEFATTGAEVWRRIPDCEPEPPGCWREVSPAKTGAGVATLAIVLGLRPALRRWRRRDGTGLARD